MSLRFIMLTALFVAQASFAGAATTCKLVLVKQLALQDGDLSLIRKKGYELSRVEAQSLNEYFAQIGPDQLGLRLESKIGRMHLVFQSQMKDRQFLVADASHYFSIGSFSKLSEVANRFPTCSEVMTKMPVMRKEAEIRRIALQFKNRIAPENQQSTQTPGVSSSLSWGASLIEFESLFDGGDSRSVQRRAVAEYTSLLAASKAALDKENQSLNPTFKIDAIRKALLAGPLGRYCGSQPLLGKMLATGKKCGNCVARTTLTTSILQDLPFDIPKPWVPAVRLYWDHVEPVLFDPGTKRVWELVTGKTVKDPEAFILKPEVVMWAALRTVANRNSYLTSDMSSLLTEAFRKKSLTLQQPSGARSPHAWITGQIGFSSPNELYRFGAAFEYYNGAAPDYAETGYEDSRETSQSSATTGNHPQLQGAGGWLKGLVRSFGSDRVPLSDHDKAKFKSSLQFFPAVHRVNLEKIISKSKYLDEIKDGFSTETRAAPFQKHQMLVPRASFDSELKTMKGYPDVPKLQMKVEIDLTSTPSETPYPRPTPSNPKMGVLAHDILKVPTLMMASHEEVERFNALSLPERYKYMEDRRNEAVRTLEASLTLDKSLRFLRAPMEFSKYSAEELRERISELESMIETIDRIRLLQSALPDGVREKFKTRDGDEPLSPDLRRRILNSIAKFSEQLADHHRDALKTFGMENDGANSIIHKVARTVSPYLGRQQIDPAWRSDSEVLKTWSQDADLRNPLRPLFFKMILDSEFLYTVKGTDAEKQAAQKALAEAKEYINQNHFVKSPKGALVDPKEVKKSMTRTRQEKPLQPQENVYGVYEAQLAAPDLSASTNSATQPPMEHRLSRQEIHLDPNFLIALVSSQSTKDLSHPVTQLGMMPAYREALVNLLTYDQSRLLMSSLWHFSLYTRLEVPTVSSRSASAWVQSDLHPDSEPPSLAKLHSSLLDGFFLLRNQSGNTRTIRGISTSVPEKLAERIDGMMRNSGDSPQKFTMSLIDHRDNTIKNCSPLHGLHHIAVGPRNVGYANFETDRAALYDEEAMKIDHELYEAVGLNVEHSKLALTTYPCRTDDPKEN